MKVWRIDLKYDLQFKELWNIVRDTDKKDGQNVVSCWPVVGYFEERMADSDVALYRDGHHRVD